MPGRIHLVGCSFLLCQNVCKMSGLFCLYLFAVKYSLGKPIHQSIGNFIRVLLVYGLWTEYFTTGFLYQFSVLLQLCTIYS